jgi:hypothetical protein
VEISKRKRRMRTSLRRESSKHSILAELIKIMMNSREREKNLRYSSEKRRSKYLIACSQSSYREEMFKQKRAFLGEGATNTPAGATNQNVAAAAQNQPIP